MKELPSLRFTSLDVLRGLTVALMIIVNSPGSWDFIYPPFQHAAWDGFTPTDLVFPSFLFVVGNAMSFSFRKFETLGENEFLKKIFKRTLIIFSIGLLLNAFPFFTVSSAGSFEFQSLSTLRIMGVLQRIALCYCLASLIVYYLKNTGAVLLSLVILISYWVVLFVLGDQLDPYSLEGNSVLKLDLFIFGANHLYDGEGVPFDPEGLLSTFPAVVNVIVGYLVGLFIQKKGNSTKTVVSIILGGGVLLFISLIWDFGFPINKKIWTSSFVLHTVGWDMVILGMLTFIIEVNRSRNWTYFFEVFGRNTLFSYILASLVISVLSLINVGEVDLIQWIYENWFKNWAGDHLGSLLFALVYMLLIWCVCYLLDKRKIYIKV